MQRKQQQGRRAAAGEVEHRGRPVARDFVLLSTMMTLDRLSRAVVLLAVAALDGTGGGSY